MNTSFDALLRFDWRRASTAQFAILVNEFEDWAAKQPVKDLKLPDGWNEITPELALQILLRNKRNRKVNFATVAYYARQMENHDWPETGQPIIFTVDGDLADAQHRLWACVVSKTSFTSYIVNQRKAITNVFAYIDNGRTRSAKDALSTAGVGGALSDVMAQTITMATEFDSGAYTAGSKHKLPKHPPTYFLTYAATHPELETAANLMAGEHLDATKTIGHKDVATFLGLRIIQLFGESELDSFMEEVGSVDAEDSAVIALQAEMEKNRHSVEPLKKHQVLGLAIKAFNAWQDGATLKKLRLSVNEDYPVFNEPKAVPAAAE